MVWKVVAALPGADDSVSKYCRASLEPGAKWYEPTLLMVRIVQHYHCHYMSATSSAFVFGSSQFLDLIQRIRLSIFCEGFRICTRFDMCFIIYLEISWVWSEPTAKSITSPPTRLSHASSVLVFDSERVLKTSRCFCSSTALVEMSWSHPKPYQATLQTSWWLQSTHTITKWYQT